MHRSEKALFGLSHRYLDFSFFVFLLVQGQSRNLSRFCKVPRAHHNADAFFLVLEGADRVMNLELASKTCLLPRFDFGGFEYLPLCSLNGDRDNRQVALPPSVADDHDQRVFRRCRGCIS